MDVWGDPVVVAHRNQINTADRELLRALNRRAELVAALHAHKRERGYQTIDPDRERRLLEHLREINPGPLPGESVERVYRLVLDVCTQAAAARATGAAGQG